MAVASADTTTDTVGAPSATGTQAESPGTDSPATDSPATDSAATPAAESAGLADDSDPAPSDSSVADADTAAVDSGASSVGGDAVSDRVAARISDALSPALTARTDRIGPAVDVSGPDAADNPPAVVALSTETATVAPAAPAATPSTAVGVTTASAAGGSGQAQDFAAVDLLGAIWQSLVDAAAAGTTASNKSPVIPVAVEVPTALLTAGTLSVPLTLGTESPVPDALTPQLLSSLSYATAPADGPAKTSGGGWLAYLATQISLGVREALRNVSVTELALAALPGLVGLLFFFASGVGLGRRQARFGFALQSTGAMRFAAPGPLGVVRSGSQIAVRVRGASRAHLTAVSHAA
ncbi:MAG: hypothetical protein FGM25_07605 [Mycobacterium sp.]|nr:hypothetical protein [Mycobacterium sp.]